MSAFQSYAGVYEFAGARFLWRCYATVRVYEVRNREHRPHPPAPAGKKWIWKEIDHHGREAGCLVDGQVTDFSQILLHVEPEPRRQPQIIPFASEAAAL